MARPPLPVGQHGSISYRGVGTKLVRAACYVRDADGRRREVTAQGTSKDNARARLLAKIDGRSGFGAELSATSTIGQVAAVWLDEIDRAVAGGHRAPNTARIYRGAFTGHVEPGVGALRIREATAARLDAFLVTMRSRHGAGITKTVRTVLNGILGHAVRRGAATANPMRDVARVPGQRRRRMSRAMTSVERDAWLAAMEADEIAVRHDLPDLTRIMLATGVRIGECLGILLDEVDIDSKSLVIEWKIDRVKGVGLVRGPTKSAAGDRTLRLPGWAVDVLARRGDARAWRGPLFPDRRGGWRDPSNTAASLREARDRAGFDWVTSHVFRRTVATVMDEAGMSAREIADQLGHSKVSMTQDVYLGRKAVGGGAAVALEGVFDSQCAE